MKLSKAIEIIQDERDHVAIHAKEKNKAPEYYKEMNDLVEAYDMLLAIAKGEDIC